MDYSGEDIQKILAEKMADADRTGLFSISGLPPDVMWAVLEAVSDRNKKLESIRDAERTKQGLPPETHVERLIRQADAVEAAIMRLPDAT